MTVSATRIRRTVLTAGVLLSLCALPVAGANTAASATAAVPTSLTAAAPVTTAAVVPLPPGQFSVGEVFGTPGPLWKWKGYHTGQDFDAASGTPILASAAGTVTHAGEGGAYGTMAQIRHSPSASTLYAHMSAIYVTQGQQVHTGDVIGLVGSTGNSTGPHLHFEVRNSADDPVSPVSWLEGAGLKTGAVAVPGAATGTVTPPKPKIAPALLAALRADVATATADAQAAAGRAAVAAADNHRLALAMSLAASRARTADAEVATRQGHLSTLVRQAYIYAPGAGVRPVVEILDPGAVAFTSADRLASRMSDEVTASGHGAEAAQTAAEAARQEVAAAAAAASAAETLRAQTATRLTSSLARLKVIEAAAR